MKLTTEEKKIILQKRKKEEANKPQKQGFTKDELFVVDRQEFAISDWILDSKEKEENIAKFISIFKLACNKDAKFVCYIEEDGAEQWYDEIYGIEAKNDKWARKYLRDIGPYKKK